jgi:hypothetical protein
MTTYTTLTDAELSQDKPVTQAKLRALRDNPLAIAEGDVSAPNIQIAAIEPPTSGASTYLIADFVTSQIDTTSSAYASQKYKANDSVRQSFIAAQTGGYRISVNLTGTSPAARVFVNGLLISEQTGVGFKTWDISVSKAQLVMIQLKSNSGTSGWKSVQVFSGTRCLSVS